MPAWMSIRAHHVVLAVLLDGCAGTQTIHFSTTEPAELWIWGERVCAKTPCDYSYERQGCGFPRMMATNQMVVEARTPDGRVAHEGVKDYCDVPDDWLIEIPKEAKDPAAADPPRPETKGE